MGKSSTLPLVHTRCSADSLTLVGRKVAVGENDAVVVKKVRAPKPKRIKDRKKCTPYTEFVKETSPKLHEKFPDIKFAQLGTHLRDIWHEVSPPEYEYYKNKHIAAVAAAVAEEAAARALLVDVAM